MDAATNGTVPVILPIECPRHFSVRLDWWRFGGFEYLSITLCDRTNSPANSLFTRCTVPLPTPTIVATFRMPCPALRCSRMAFAIFGDTFDVPASSPAGARGRDRQDPTANDLPFRLAEDGRHLDHGPSHRRGAVDRLLVGIEGNAGIIEFSKGVGDVENAAPKSGDGPHHQDIEPSPYRVPEHRGECGALIPAFCAASCASQPPYRSARATKRAGRSMLRTPT